MLILAAVLSLAGGSRRCFKNTLHPSYLVKNNITIVTVGACLAFLVIKGVHFNGRFFYRQSLLGLSGIKQAARLK